MASAPLNASMLARTFTGPANVGYTMGPGVAATRRNNVIALNLERGNVFGATAPYAPYNAPNSPAGRVRKTRKQNRKVGGNFYVEALAFLGKTYPGANEKAAELGIEDVDFVAAKMLLHHLIRIGVKNEAGFVKVGRGKIWEGPRDPETGKKIRKGFKFDYYIWSNGIGDYSLHARKKGDVGKELGEGTHILVNYHENDEGRY